MENKTHLSLGFIRSRGFRLSASVMLAFLLVAIVVFVPAGIGEAFHISVPALPGGEPVDLPLPFRAEVVQAANSLTITKFATPADFVDQGGFLTYTLVITNVNAGSLIGLIVTDTVPLNTSCATADGGAIFDQTDASGGFWGGQQPSCNSGVAKWTYLDNANTFNNGESVELSYRVVVAEPLRDQVDKIVNEAGYQVESVAPTAFTVTGQRTVTNLVNAPLWQIRKTAIPSPTVQPDDLLTYTLTITNIGNLITTGDYTITDPLPANTSFVSASPPGNFAAGNVTWVLSAPVAIDESFMVTYTVMVTPDLIEGTEIVNQNYNITGGNVFSQAFGAPVSVTVETPITVTVTKTDDPYDPVMAGNVLTYTLIFANDASSKGPASNVVVTDTVPANTTLIDAGFVGGALGSIFTSPLTVTWIISDPVPAGNTVLMTMTVRVDSPLPNNTVITNTYGVSASNHLTTISPPLPVVTTTVESAPTLNIAKSAFPSVVDAGGLLTYTIAYSNSGNADATNVVITDTLSDFVSYVSSIPPGNHDGSPFGGLITWTIGPVAGEGAGSGTITVTTIVTSPLPNNTSISNTVEIGSSEGVTDSVTIFTLVNSAPDLEISKSVLPTPTVEAGELLTYTLIISNVGNEDATQVVISDTIPANTTFDSATPGINPPSPASGSPFGWLVGNLLVGVPQVYTFAVRVDSPLTNGTEITNSATISNPEEIDTSNTVTTTVVSTPTLEIFKIGQPEPVPAGGLITYTIRFTNTGNMDASGVVITDIFPLNTTFAGESMVGAPTVDGRSWIIGLVPGDGGNGVLTFTMAVSSPLAANTVLTDVVMITADQPTSDIYTATNTITSTPILEISKIESIDPVKAGTDLIYTITYTNTGNADATGVLITDTYEGDFVSIVATPPGTVLPAPLPARIVWNIGTLPADSVPRTQVITVTLPVSLTEGSVLTDSVVIASAQGVTQTDTITTEVNALEADLQINKTRFGSGDVIAGGLITYTITITNAGPDTVNAVVTDTFDPGRATFVACPDGGCTNLGGGVVIWNVNGFTNTQTLSLVLRTLSFSGTFTNNVEITHTIASAVDPVDFNNQDSEDTVVRFPTADLQINKTRFGSGDVIAGELIIYTITITNAGPDTVNAVVTDTFDPGRAVFVSCPDGGCTNLGGGVVIWNVNDFNPGPPKMLSLVLRTLAFSGTFTNNVEITHTIASAVDPVDSNNQDSEDTVVRFPIADLQIAKTTSITEAIGGDLIEYTIVVTNTAGSDTVDAIVTDIFNPSEATLVNCLPASICSGTGPVSWNLDAFAPGTQTLTLTLRATGSFSGTLVNTASITFTTAGVDPDLVNNEASVAIQVRIVFRSTHLPLILKEYSPPPPQIDLTITDFFISPANLGSSDTVVVTVVIQNQGINSTGEGFWVDFYVNPTGKLPNDPSLGRDRRWNNSAINSSQGVAWEITTPLAASGVLTLTSNGVGGLAPAPEQTDWDEHLPSGNNDLYAFVDSFDKDDPTGPTNVEIVETNEDNNMDQLIGIIVTGLGTGSSEPFTPAQLPARSDLGN